jgi:hypothetical protein
MKEWLVFLVFFILGIFHPWLVSGECEGIIFVFSSRRNEFGTFIFNNVKLESRILKTFTENTCMEVSPVSKVKLSYFS